MDDLAGGELRHLGPGDLGQVGGRCQRHLRGLLLLLGFRLQQPLLQLLLLHSLHITQSQVTRVEQSYLGETHLGQTRGGLGNLGVPDQSRYSAVIVLADLSRPGVHRDLDVVPLLGVGLAGRPLHERHPTPGGGTPVML